MPLCIVRGESEALHMQVRPALKAAANKNQERKATINKEVRGREKFVVEKINPSQLLGTSGSLTYRQLEAR